MSPSVDFLTCECKYWNEIARPTRGNSPKSSWIFYMSIKKKKEKKKNCVCLCQTYRNSDKIFCVWHSIRRFIIVYYAAQRKQEKEKQTQIFHYLWIQLDKPQSEIRFMLNGCGPFKQQISLTQNWYLIVWLISCHYRDDEPEKKKYIHSIVHPGNNMISTIIEEYKNKQYSICFTFTRSTRFTDFSAAK